MDIRSFILGFKKGKAIGGGSDFPVNDFFARTATEIALTGVTTLGQYSFYQYNTLETVYLPDVTKISGGAISNCSKLSNVVMGEGLITIDGAIPTISSCPNIKNLEIPSTVETIGWNAFTGLTGLETVTFLGTPKTIGSQFSSAVLPPSVITINVPWSEGEVAGAPWGATSAQINYNYTGG